MPQKAAQFSFSGRNRQQNGPNRDGEPRQTTEQKHAYATRGLMNPLGIECDANYLR
jgi:hypothetical protein